MTDADLNTELVTHAQGRTCHTLPAMPVSLGSERWYWICGCDHRTPICADRRTARQALDNHQRGPS